MIKSLLLLLLALSLYGCGVSINHNIATINGKTYLVETKNYTDGFGSIWSKEPTFREITDADLAQSDKVVISPAKAELARLAAECNVQSVKAQSRPNYKKLYKCIVDKLAALDASEN